MSQTLHQIYQSKAIVVTDSSKKINKELQDKMKELFSEMTCVERSYRDWETDRKSVV